MKEFNHREYMKADKWSLIENNFEKHQSQFKLNKDHFDMSLIIFKHD